MKYDRSKDPKPAPVVKPKAEVKTETTAEPDPISKEVLKIGRNINKSLTASCIKTSWESAVCQALKAAQGI